MTGPTIPIPTIGDVTLGSFQRSKGKIDLDLQELNEENARTFKNITPHM